MIRNIRLEKDRRGRFRGFWGLGLVISWLLLERFCGGLLKDSLIFRDWILIIIIVVSSVKNWKWTKNNKQNSSYPYYNKTAITRSVWKITQNSVYSPTINPTNTEPI